MFYLDLLRFFYVPSIKTTLCIYPTHGHSEAPVQEWHISVQLSSLLQ